MAMKEDAQMIILAAMVIALCLIGLMACMASVDGLTGYSAGGAYLSQETVENVQWAQDAGLAHAAAEASACAWQDRNKAADSFCQRLAMESDQLSDSLMKHGVSYEISLNRSMADRYMIAHPEPDAVNIGGVLVKPGSGNAKIYGCAYDMSIGDGVTGYRVSRMVIF